MRFGPVSLHAAEGKILAHNIFGPDGRRLLRKGKPLTQDDIQSIRVAGLEQVYVAELAPEDLDENQAANRISAVLSGCKVSIKNSLHGRVNLLAESDGLLRIDTCRLEEVNQYHGIAIATRLHNTPVRAGDKVATIKVIPYAVPEPDVLRIEMVGKANGPIVAVHPFQRKKVVFIYAGAEIRPTNLLSDYGAVFERLKQLGIEDIRIISRTLENHEDDGLARCIAENAESESGLVLLASDTAIMDRNDVLPQALEKAGGAIECVGAPVDPGNLFMLGYLGSTPVIGVPGCARSNRKNIVDLVLPRVLAGDRLNHRDIIRLGNGGLLG